MFYESKLYMVLERILTLVGFAIWPNLRAVNAIFRIKMNITKELILIARLKEQTTSILFSEAVRNYLGLTI